MSNEFNSDELNPPEWMNQSFFVTVLKSFESDKNNITVNNVNLAPATKNGDHYASVMFRAKVTYSTSTKKNEVISLIVKTMPVEDGQKKELLGDTPLFDTEIKMYSEVLPEMERLLKQAGEETIISPK